jgi:CheY-like chemotaxis protein
MKIPPFPFRKFGTTLALDTSNRGAEAEKASRVGEPQFMSNEPILIIDDSPMNLKLERVLLEIEKYQVRTAKDAPEALRVLETYKPGLILMDLQMPGMDGLELAKKLKADARYKDIVIIMATSYALKGDADRALAAGCDGYLTKPIDTQALPVLVAGFLRK